MKKPLSKTKRIKLLKDAQEHIQKGIDKIVEAVEDTNRELYCKSYIISHLNLWAKSCSGIDLTIPRIIEDFENGSIEIYDEEEG